MYNVFGYQGQMLKSLSLLMWQNNDDKLESYDTYIYLKDTEKKLKSR